MKAARFYDKEDIRVETIEEPKAGDGMVLVDVEWCGICGSDLHNYLIGPQIVLDQTKTANGKPEPLTYGHELCGRVKNPPHGSRFTGGEAVMVDPRIICNSCLPCKSGQTHCCANLGYVGGTVGGGFGEVVAVEEDMLYPLGTIPLEYAAVIEPLAVVQHAVKESGITQWKDKTTLVLGGGPIGFALLLVLRAHGATNVVVSEPALLRRQQVSEYAQAVIDPTKEHVGDKCRELTEGRGVDVVFDCAGVPIALEAGCDAIKNSGLYMMVAVWEKPLTLNCWQFLRKHITLKGVLIFSTEDFREVMKMLADGRLSGYEKLVTGRIGVDDIVEKGFRELIDNKDKHIKILVSPKNSFKV